MLEGTVPRSVRTTVPPDAASAAAGRLAGYARVIGDAGQQGQRELTGILAKSRAERRVPDPSA
jgi:hypothetical protein